MLNRETRPSLQGQCRAKPYDIGHQVASVHFGLSGFGTAGSQSRAIPQRFDKGVVTVRPLTNC
jgi:hypothetical protein